MSRPAGGRRDGGWRRARLQDSYVYLCVGVRPPRGVLADFLDGVLAAGVDILQLRDKDAGRDDVVSASAAFREAALRHDALFIMNDDPELAVAVDADGVHVGQDDPHPDEARRIVGPERLVGWSTHSPAQVDVALGTVADTFTVGPVHATPTKAGRPGIGLDPVRHAAAVAGDRPWFVSGGMAPSSAPAVLAAGGRRLVVVRALTEADDPPGVARALGTLLREQEG
jgi:thiamine-phosphate pyrophosphorylase